MPYNEKLKRAKDDEDFRSIAMIQEERILDVLKVRTSLLFRKCIYVKTSKIMFCLRVDTENKPRLGRE